MDTADLFYPLSPMQQGMLFQTLYAPEQRIYERQCVCTIDGDLDATLFRRAWESVVSRHDVLRTGFLWQGLKQPVQVVHRNVPLPWRQVDWTTEQNVEQRLARFLDEDREHGFDLSLAPLLRATLIETGKTQQVFVLSFHHTVLDGWSLAQVFREAVEAYESLKEGKQPFVSPAVPYRNYIAWLHQRNPSEAEIFWRNYLKGIASATPLGFGASAVDTRNARYDEIRVGVEESRANRWKESARRSHVTLNTYLQGAWALVLSRYSGEREVVFGNTVAGRPADVPGVDEIVGVFINTIPTRVKAEPTCKIAEWLQSLQASQASTREFEYSALADIQNWSELNARQQLFDTLLVFENTPGAQIFEGQRGDFRISTALPFERTGYPLTACAYVHSGFSLRLVYDASRLDRRPVERLAAHVLNVIDQFASNPGSELARVSLLTGEESGKLQAWNDTACGFDSTPVPQLIERQAELTPDRVAVSWRGKHYTYADVNARANRLAHYLRSQGAGRGTLVGVCMERSLELVVSLLAVTKSGAAYVPLDPSYPADRLAFMIADSEAPVLLISEAVAGRVPATDAKLIRVDSAELAAQVEKFPAIAPDANINPDDIVYVIYTSGSTGQPKGAMNVHRGLTNRLLWMQAEYQLGADDCVAQKTPFSFDVSVWEFFWPLLAGARIAVAEPGAHQDPAALTALIAAESVTTLHFVPSMLTAFLAPTDGSKLSSLRRVICSGEALPGTLQENFFKLLPGVELHNLYGPTEASIDVTHWRCRREDGTAAVPIGHPIANTEIHILDADLNPQPVGIAGELYIGGVGVGRGYWKRPELTAEKFIAAPGFSSILYRTGDLARRREDGAIEYLGRIDHQVKLRGLRIELGEVESVIRTHPSVADCVVHTLPHSEGDQRLVAWIVTHKGFDKASLKAHIAAFLPEFMVPSAFVQMDTLPLNPSGKVDRKALPAPEREQFRERSDTAPRTPTERALADLFAEVLRVERVSREDDFFELGGHSLLATQLVARIRRVLDINVPLRTVFESRTVAGIAGVIGTLAQSGPARKLRRGTEVLEGPLSLAQQRIWFVEQLHPGTAAYNIGISVRLHGSLNRGAMKAAYADLCARHEALRTVFPVENGNPIQRISPSADNSLEELEIAEVPEHAREVEAARIARELGARPFDIEHGPLVRATLIRIGETDHLLVVIAHHLVSDGWSQRVILRDLMGLYESHMGQPIRLPELPIRYLDFAHAQNEWAQSSEMLQQLEYWQEKLVDAPAMTALPTDYPRNTVQQFKGEIRERKWRPELSEAIKQLGQRESVTAFMVLMSALLVLLQRYSGQDDCVVGTPISGRGLEETGEVVGLFANTLVFRNSLHGNPTVRELLARVRQVALEAYANQDVPFERLVEVVSPQRNLSYSPLFQVGFVVEDELEAGSAGGVKWVPRYIDSGVAKVDVMLGVVQGRNGWRCVLQYDSSLFTAETADRILCHYQNLVEGMVRSAEACISDVEILSGEELQRQVVTWNDTRVPLDSMCCLQDCIREHARRTPGKIAVSDGESELTYAELELRTNQLARYLRARGVGVESLVGIGVERSLDMVTAVFATMKAGGAYLPLDPSYPPARLEYMVRDSGAKLLITNTTSAPVFVGCEVDKVVLDVDRERIAQIPATSLATITGPRSLAYVIYTSGSTGRPKGVMVEHGGLWNLAEAQRRAFDLRPDDRVLQFASLSFDASIFEMAMAIRQGGTICLATRESLMSPVALHRLLAEQHVTVVTLPPSVAVNLPPYPLPDLRIFTVAGEPCPAELVHRWAAGRRFFNLYGPTETTVWATYEECTGGKDRPTIGRPIANVQVYVLDSGMAPAPVRVAGEIFIGGGGVARGYVGRDELTRERFVPDPFHREPSGRLYRTGDLGRYEPDGRIRFIGRIDDQVKLRGFRIELGEIENTLRQQDGVREACVFVAGDSDEQRKVLAYVVPAEGARLDTAEVREGIKKRLPSYMIPSAIVAVPSIPLTPNGKVDRKALPAPDAVGEHGRFEAPANQLETALAEIWREVLGMDHVGRNDNFFDVGGHSLLMTKVQSRIQQKLNTNVSVLDLFRFPSISALASFLAGEKVEGAVDYPNYATAGGEPIAVIGMAGRFPGANSVEQFWHNLCQGTESISFFSSEELVEAGVDRRLLDNPKFVKAAGILDRPEWFDGDFFGFTPLEADITDPQHRVFLECAYEALEDAGCAPTKSSARIGVFAGAGLSNYFLANVLPNAELLNRTGLFQAFLGAGTDFVPSRVSYKLNLTGPAVNVQSACSTSLLAVHMAMHSLNSGECEVALAGGVTIHFPQKNGYVYEDDGIFSADGHCRAFDKQATGTVSGSGAAVVVLKPLSRALADRDTIHAVILSSAINNDGSDKVGYTAPSVEGQTAVIKAAYRKGGIDPSTVTYIETHGTGTILGDPIEIAALKQAFAADDRRRRSCAIGSVKTNVGHLDAAAGVTGLIKAVLALKHKLLPPSLNFAEPNPALGLEASPFYVNHTLQEWKQPEGRRRAGVSSFGIGGTNVHMVLEEPPAAESSISLRDWQLLTVAAKTVDSLQAGCEELITRLESHPAADLADAAFTLHVGRNEYAYRRSILCRSVAEAATAVRDNDALRIVEGAQEGPSTPVFFLLPGGGAQYTDMGATLVDAEPVYRDAVDTCARILRAHLDGTDIRDWMYSGRNSAHEVANELRGTRLGLPALFATEYATAQLLLSWGIQPSALLGHSLGEYTAACLSGVFTLDDALALVAARGRLMAGLPRGGMLVVAQGEDQLTKVLPDDVAIAVISRMDECLISGREEAIRRFETTLAQRSIEYRRVNIDVAAHSPVVEAMLPAFRDVLRQIAFHPPAIPFISNLTGTWIRPEQAMDPEYWCSHLRGTVRLAEGASELLRTRKAILAEVGPGHSLSATLSKHASRQESHVFVPCMRHVHDRQLDDSGFVLGALGRMWVNGARIDWNAFHTREKLRKIPLNTYFFQRDRHWIEPAPRDHEPAVSHATSLDDCFWAPVWKQSNRRRTQAQPSASHPASWLIFVDDRCFGVKLGKQLSAQGHRVMYVRAGERFECRDTSTCIVDPADPQSYASLVAELKRSGGFPTRIVHGWSVGTRGSRLRTAAVRRLWIERGLMSLVHFCRARAEAGINGSLHIDILSSNLHSVCGERTAQPEKAPLLGACLVIPQEFPGITCRNIDIDLSAPGAYRDKVLTDMVCAETMGPAGEVVVALRDRRRWIKMYERVSLPACKPEHLRASGHYLLTGGLGALGLEIASHLSRAVRADLVLVTRSPFPPPANWEDWLSDHSAEDATSIRIERLKELQRNGSRVLVVQADVTDMQQMRAAVRLAEAKFGRIHGVVHAAGVPGGGLLQLRSATSITEVLAPKIEGASVLAELFGSAGLDFLALFSSVSSLTGAVGLVDYCAANAYLDAFAHARRSYGLNIVTINWNAWSGLGMAAARVLPPGFEAWKTELEGNSLSASEGVDAFARILESGLSQVVVSREDPMQIARRAQLIREQATADATRNRRNLHARPKASATFVAPRTDTEQIIAELWEALLGIERAGANDNFFNLGGHSLLGTRLIARLQSAFDVCIPLRCVFEAPTIAGLATLVDEKRLQKEEAERTRLLQTIRDLPDDAVESELAKRASAIHT